MTHKNGFFNTESGRRKLLDELELLRRNEQMARMQRNVSTGALRMAQGSEALSDADGDMVACIRRRVAIEQVFSECRPQTAPVPTNTDTVQMGTTVTIQYEDENVDPSCDQLAIVGHGEGDATEEPQAVAYTSPAGKALMRKSVDDRVKLPQGWAIITDIRFSELPKQQLSKAS